MAKYPWWTPQSGEEEIRGVTEVIRSQYLNEGEVVEKFERTIASLVGSRHAIATTSGTSALFLALKAKGIGPGDEVLVPDITFIATANAVALTGATPVLVDVDENSANLSVSACVKALTPRTRALVPVHVSGRGVDMTAVMQLARQHGLIVVEDAAEALLSRKQGKYLGTFGDAGCFSFSPNKTITTGQGGMIVTDDDGLALSLRQWKDQGRPVRGTGGDDIHPAPGFNFKMTNLQAAVGLAQQEKLRVRAKRLVRHYEIYRDRLGGLSGLRFPGFESDLGEIPQWVDVEVDYRNDLDAALKAQDMHCRRFWHPLHTQVPYKKDDAGLPISTRLAPRLLWLPSAFTLNDSDIETICASICAFAKLQRPRKVG